MKKSFYPVPAHPDRRVFSTPTRRSPSGAVRDWMGCRRPQGVTLRKAPRGLDRKESWPALSHPSLYYRNRYIFVDCLDLCDLGLYYREVRVCGDEDVYMLDVSA